MQEIQSIIVQAQMRWQGMTQEQRAEKVRRAVYYMRIHKDVKREMDRYGHQERRERDARDLVL